MAIPGPPPASFRSEYLALPAPCPRVHRVREREDGETETGTAALPGGRRTLILVLNLYRHFSPWQTHHVNRNLGVDIDLDHHRTRG